MRDDRGDIDQGYLGEAATRLSRLLEVRGLVSPKFHTREDILPVVVLGDATLPGYGDNRLRRFACAHQTGAGAGIGSTFFRATADLIITRISCFKATAGASTISLIGAATTPPVVPATADVFFLDRVQGTEPAPALTGDGDGTALTGALIYRFGNETAANINLHAGLEPFLLPALATLQIRGAAVAVVQNVNISGMVL